MMMGCLMCRFVL